MHPKPCLSNLVVEVFKVSGLIVFLSEFYVNKTADRHLSTKLIIWLIDKLWIILAQFFQKFLNLKKCLVYALRIWISVVCLVYNNMAFFPKVQEIMRSAKYFDS